MRRARLAMLLLCGSLLTLALLPKEPAEVRANTFSVVAYDPEAKEWGVATASRVLAVGAWVPFAKAGTGAIASQSHVNPTYGPRGLELLTDGKSAEDVVKQLTEEDKGRDHRQLAVIDAKGTVAHYSGKKCSDWYGSKVGKHHVCLGNLLAGEDVVTAMNEAYEGAKGPLAWRLLAALEAGHKAGGDKRGKQSAAVLVVRDKPAPGEYGQVVDLRVDDHEDPVRELARVLGKQVERPKAE